MQSDPLLFFRISSGFGLIVSIFATWLVLKNTEHLFGRDPDVPSENESGRTYSQLLVYGLLAHALVCFAAGLIIL